MTSRFWIDEVHLEAQRVLRDFLTRFPDCPTEPQVPIEDILDLHFELRLLKSNLDPGVSGLYRVESGIVEVNQAEPRMRQRFTCAHELGHHVLHLDRLRGRKVIRDLAKKVREDVREDRLARHSSDETLPRRKEAEANVFASEILMPSGIVVPLYRRGLTEVSELAGRFGVSRLAMEIKLMNLRLIRGRARYEVFEFFKEKTKR